MCGVIIKSSAENNSDFKGFCGIIMIIKVATVVIPMFIKEIIILILPIILHIKGNIALIVILSMNSIINLINKFR